MNSIEEIPKNQIRRDKYNREIITLDPGSCDNPYLVQDHGILNLGLLAGVSFVDGHSYVLQYNALAKAFYTNGSWSERMAPNHDQAKNLKKLKTPKKAKHFDTWDNGDDMTLNGAMSVALYVGVSVYAADTRLGAILGGNWTKHITKVDENLVRIAFTREGGIGITGRIQPLPLTKMEASELKNWQGTLTYDFDRSTEEGRKSLKHALKNKIFVKQDSDNDNVTLLTQRTMGRKKFARNLQAGIPFIVRLRSSWHTVKMKQATKNERNDRVTKLASKGYMKQKAYRYINLPKTNKHKKWKHFKYTNYHYNKIAEGTAKTVKNDITKEIRRSDIRLSMEISFNHDKVKVEKVNKYNKIIAKKVGINDFVIDTGYKKKKQIGYSGLTYRLNVNTLALNDIIAKAVADKHLFDEPATTLINTYFKDKNDPHSICRGTLTNRRLCIALIKLNTKRKLNKIAADLRKLNKPKIIKSKSSSSTILAKISRRLRTNQFVLQSFIIMLPENPKGYGTFEIEGERYLGKKFIVDPNNQRQILDPMYDPNDDLLFDRNDALMRDEDYDMFW
ncbi:MAG: hypothetical protein BWZ03_00338 [bacterium ADurb.BinA186]|nr:MAG: hypothetical protein BWZ03_00338 [bacterium ADurb.BinA186]